MSSSSHRRASPIATLKCARALARIPLDGSPEVSLRDAIQQLGKQAQLTEEELMTMLPSGASTTFGSRVSWAKTYLKQAGLIEQPRRGAIRLTQRGGPRIGSFPSEDRQQAAVGVPGVLGISIAIPASALRHQRGEASLGVSVAAVYEVKRIDSDFFSDN